MRRIISLCVYTLLCCYANALYSCSDAAEEEGLPNGFEQLTASNFPVIDGSDSTTPLRTIIMCKLLGFDYQWERSPFTQYLEDGAKEVNPTYTCSKEETYHLLVDCLKRSNTHDSFVKLIDGNVELVIAARGKSRDEARYASEKNVSLIEKPIAKDALAFMVNNDNPVNTLSIEELQSIYTGKITNWKDVGGKDASITPYIRNANSGSQEKFETMVMAGFDAQFYKDWPEMRIGSTMEAPYFQLEYDKNGIAFTPFYFYDVIVDNGKTKCLAINGIPLSKENISDGSYPYVTEVYAAVRADIDKSSYAYKIFELLTKPWGKSIIKESGYIPL